MPKQAKPAKPKPTPWDAERIKALRHRLGLTQTQLGEEVGAAIRTVQYWEEGRTPTGAATKMLDMLEARYAQSS